MSEWCTVVKTCSSGLGPGQKVRSVHKMSEWCTVVETCSSGLGPGQHPRPRARRSLELGRCINMNVWLAMKAIHLRSGDQVSATQPNLIQVHFAPAGGLWKKLIFGTLRLGDLRIS